MPDEPSLEFRWFLEMGNALALRYAFRWIAVDGTKIDKDWSAIDSIVVADGDTLGETVAIVQWRNFVPLSLFYAFIRPPLTHKRQ